jgi:hypothetical protein
MKRPRYFQWLQGENSGIISKLDNITEMDGEYFYNFDDGESCNQRFISKMTTSPAELKDKFMVEIVSPNDPWRVEEIGTGFFKDAMTQENVDVPPLEDITGASGQGNNLDLSKSAVGTTKFIAPRYKGPMYELPSLDEYFYAEEVKPAVQKPKLDGATATFKRSTANVVPEPVVEPVVTPQPTTYTPPSVQVTPKYESPVDATDPVRILAKTCKKRDTDVDLTLSIKLPSKAVYDIADAEFENGGEKFINYLIEGIDINSIISELRNALIIAYASSDNE